MARGQALSVAAICLSAALFWSTRAHAFEREWHVGGGVGLSAYRRYYSAGPALGLHAGYGISDVFDLKLELLTSYHGYDRASSANGTEHAAPYSAVAGLSYKLDVLQWIPYGAVLLGYQHIAGALPAGEPFRRDDVIGALVLGLDYAMTRNFGLGASLRADVQLSGLIASEALTPLLRAEYHWGF